MTIVHNPPPAGLEPDPQRRSDRIYEHALALAFGPSRRPTPSNALFSRLYWLSILIGASWLFSMAIDRAVPVEVGPRTVVNVDARVRQGERLLISSTRKRIRSCELVRRVHVIDGAGRRIDYEAERYDAYGPVTRTDAPPEPEIVGPYIPLDAAPGRGRSFTVLAWDCNPLQRALGWSIVSILPPVEFEILDRHASR